MYQYRIKGFIPTSKIPEFEQSAREILSHKTWGCSEFWFSSDLASTNMYHFHSIWKDREELNRFMKSDDHTQLIGSYKVLGSIEKEEINELRENSRSK